jgi:uncharacterized protein (TIGR00725 family)
MARRIIGVIGAGSCEPEISAHARDVGRLLAREDCIVLTGGLGGVMEAAARGAQEAGGLALGILPGSGAAEGNPWLDISIPTGMGDARNAVICNSAEAFIAIGGEYGTLSEIAYALKRKKLVVSLGSWTEGLPVEVVETPAEAVQRVLTRS